MVTVCAWCQKFMGCREPFHNHELSHGICDDCREREQRLPAGVLLVVSRQRASEASLLRSLFRGIPGSSIVVDRRSAERRRFEPVVVETADRRAGERRRASSLLVV